MHIPSQVALTFKSGKQHRKAMQVNSRQEGNKGW